MRTWLFGMIFLLFLGCGGPRATTNLHFLSTPETNDGNALPLHVIPVDGAIRLKLDSMSAEDWFVSDQVETLTGIQKRVLRGAQSEVVQMSRRDEKNDFIVVVDFAGIENADQQKLFIGDQYYKAKDVYVVVTRDRMRVVNKSVFEDYLKGY